MTRCKGIIDLLCVLDGIDCPLLTEVCRVVSCRCCREGLRSREIKLAQNWAAETMSKMRSARE